MVEIIVPVEPSPIRMGESTRKLARSGIWVVRVDVHCENLRDLEDIIKWLSKKTRFWEWACEDNQWDGKQWTWKMVTLVKD